MNQKKKKEELNTSGMDALVSHFEKLYPSQTNPLHFAPLISYQLGGSDPLEGISVYENKDYFHFVTFGLSELYEKESSNKEVSGYGMEFTLKLQKENLKDKNLQIKNICGILNSLARLTFQNGELFLPNEYIYTGQQEGMDAYKESNITGFITILDPEAKSIDTENGHVSFVLLIGVTDQELKAIINKETTVESLYQKLKTDVTSYNRKSLY